MKSSVVAIVVAACVGCGGGASEGIRPISVGHPSSPTATPTITTPSKTAPVPVTTVRAARPAPSSACAQKAASTPWWSSAPLRRISGVGAAYATVRYDPLESEVDVYVYACLPRPPDDRYVASVRTGGCSSADARRLGALSVLSDGRTAYVHAAIARQRDVPQGWWVAVSAEPSGAAPVLRFCGRFT